MKTLDEKLAAFDPELHGGEAMALRAVEPGRKGGPER